MLCFPFGLILSISTDKNYLFPFQEVFEIYLFISFSTCFGIFYVYFLFKMFLAFLFLFCFQDIFNFSPHKTQTQRFCIIFNTFLLQ